MSLSVVIVSYRSEDSIGSAIQSVPADAELVVVEQHSAGTALELARALRPDAVLLNSGANRGFGAGCNLGAANASGDVVLFLNPDAVLLEGAASRLHDVALKQHGIAAPHLIDENGDPSTEARRWSSSLRQFSGLLLPQRALPAFLQRDIPLGHATYEAAESVVPYAQGACFAVPRALLFSVGGFDEEYFLYGEEERLSWRAAATGSTTVLVRAASVRHVGQTSTAKVGVLAAHHMFRSEILLATEMRGKPRALGHFVLQLTGLSLLAVSAPIRRRFGPRRSADLQWTRAALRGLVSGLLRSMLSRSASAPKSAEGPSASEQRWSTESVQTAPTRTADQGSSCES